jgi:hypothetical protein
MQGYEEGGGQMICVKCTNRAIVFLGYEVE